HLSVRAKGCNGGELTSVSYLLLLDLDNDDFLETAIDSDNPPPPGRVMFNNSFNPGFSGGDTLWFDNRALPDSLLYRFALEVTYSGDTTIGWVRFNTDASPFSYTPVILPEGKHRIEWTAEQDNIERYCDRSFTVSDCAPPQVSCQTGKGVNLDIDQSGILHLSEALEGAFDNITPDTQLVLGLRRAGAGQGFPLDVDGMPQDTVMYNCEMSENQFVEVWAKDKAGNLGHCVTEILVYDTAGYCSFGLASSICATTYWNQQVVQDVNFNMTWIDPYQSPVINTLQNLGGGCTLLNELPPVNQFTLSAQKNTAVLNGVTTFDLVLISKHILALEPFIDAWKLEAADVNQSNSVTTFDILELRKLILGLTDKLPGNTPSWKFFVDTCQVWGSPFFGNCPEVYELPKLPMSNYPPNLSFKALKMGDVNGSAAAVDTLQGGTVSSRAYPLELMMTDVLLMEGEVYNIPLQSNESGIWDGMQFSLQYPPESLEILDVLPTHSLPLRQEHWAIPKPGWLTLSWSEPEPALVQAGKPLLYLKVRARSIGRMADWLSVGTSGQGLQPEVYPEEELPRSLDIRFSAEQSSVLADEQISPIPNPTTGRTVWPIVLEQESGVQLELMDCQGRSVWSDRLQLTEGRYQLEIPATALPGPGVYWWRIRLGDVVQSGKLVRM
ncbi:MAG: hypothetical protein IT261_06025, partial [Saprospiraceae bacterium]|nr:hypothetical protein [Saprospiraceae bacterium]